MNLITLRDRIRTKAIQVGLTYTEIEQLGDINNILNQTMPCLMWNYSGETNNFEQSINEMTIDIYLMTNFFDSVKVETAEYQRDFIVTQKNILRNLYIDWLKLMPFESDTDFLEVIRDNQIPISERLSIEGFLVIEFRATIRSLRGFCLDTQNIPSQNIAIFFNDVQKYEVDEDLYLDLVNQNDEEITATFEGNKIIVNVGGVCDDASYTLKDTDDNILSSGTIASGGTSDIVAPDATYTLKDTIGATLSSGTIPSGGTDDIIGPDASYLVEYLNGTDIQSGTIPSGGSLTIQVPNPNQWQRPTEWLALPTVTSTDNIFYGLLLVFENELNQLTFRAGTGLATIDYGDGSAVVTSNNTVQSYFYDYATISSAVNVWEDGRNYKQVIVTVTPTSTSTQQLFFNQGSTINAFGDNHFVDIVCAFNNNNIRLNLSRIVPAANLTHLGRKMTLLKIFKCLNTGTNTLFFDNNGFQSLNLEIFEVPSNSFIIGRAATLACFQQSTIRTEMLDLAGSTSAFLSATFTKDVRDILEAGTSTFSNAKMKACRNILNIVSTEAFWGTDIQITGNVTITSYSFRRMFQNCTTRKLHIISMPSTPTNMAINAGAFTGMVNLEDFLLTGCQIGFDITGSNMSATALDNLFTSLGNATGSQTITVTGNPGAATCNTSIATTKGFTVIT